VTLHEQVSYRGTLQVCHTAGHYMVKSTMTGTVTSSGYGRTAAEMAQNEQTVEERSTHFN